MKGQKRAKRLKLFGKPLLEWHPNVADNDSRMDMKIACRHRHQRHHSFIGTYLVVWLHRYPTAPKALKSYKRYLPPA